MRREMGSPKSTSKCEDWPDFVEDGLVGQLRLWGFDFTFPGGVELIDFRGDHGPRGVV